MAHHDWFTQSKCSGNSILETNVLVMKQSGMWAGMYIGNSGMYRLLQKCTAKFEIFEKNRSALEALEVLMPLPSEDLET